MQEQLVLEVYLGSLVLTLCLLRQNVRENQKVNYSRPGVSELVGASEVPGFAKESAEGQEVRRLCGDKF